MGIGWREIAALFFYQNRQFPHVPGSAAPHPPAQPGLLSGPDLAENGMRIRAEGGGVYYDAPKE